MDQSAKTVMSAVVIIVAGVAAYGWVVSPHVAYLRAVQKYEPVVEDVARQKIAVSGALGAKRRRLEAIRSELALLRTEFFTPVEAVTFFSGLKQLAEENGCTVDFIDFTFDSGPRDEETSPGFSIAGHHASLSLIGQYSDLVAMFEQLQQRTQEVSIDSSWIELSDVRTGRLKGRIALTIWVITGEEDGTDE
jgi:hypothetical protein